MTTSIGALDATLDADKTPCTVNSFVSLAQQGFFDDTPCHRLTTDRHLRPPVRRPVRHRHGRARLHDPGRALGRGDLRSGDAGHGQHRAAGHRWVAVLPRLPGHSAAADVHGVRPSRRRRREGGAEGRGARHRQRLRPRATGTPRSRSHSTPSPRTEATQSGPDRLRPAGSRSSFRAGGCGRPSTTGRPSAGSRAAAPREPDPPPPPPGSGWNRDLEVDEVRPVVYAPCARRHGRRRSRARLVCR